MKIIDNSTVYVDFIGGTPNKFDAIRNNGDVEFERFLQPGTKGIKFNIVKGGDFTFNYPVKVKKVVPLEYSPIRFTLPTYERNRIKDFTIVHNPELDGTPARVFTHDGIIETGKRFNNYSKPMKIFILLHEIGHFYYTTEKYCDLFAAYFFLKMGFNMSTCIYCLTNVLKDSPQNRERVMYIYNKLING